MPILKPKVLLLEKKISRASPLLTFADSLKRSGVQTTVVDLDNISTSLLIKLSLTHNYAIYQDYFKIGHYHKKLLALSSLLGVRLIRNWSGTDALKVSQYPIVAEDAVSLDKIMHSNICSCHQGIIDKLEAAGLQSSLLPQIIDFGEQEILESQFVKEGVLVYLPSARRKFYGGDIVDELIAKFPDMTFYILADTETSYDAENVENLGWLEDMSEIWDKVGLLLRVTEHDGYPRMILEAQRREKYVIHSNENLPGVIFADNLADTISRIEEYKEVTEKSEMGKKTILELLDRDPDQSLLREITKTKLTLTKSISALNTFFQNQFK